MEWAQIKGLGRTKIEALQAAGITSAEDLAGIDLRRGVQVAGVSRDALKRYKERARQALRSAGQEVPKAPYRRNGKAPARSAKATKPAQQAKMAPAAKPTEPVVQADKKRGFLGRLMSRRS